MTILWDCWLFSHMPKGKTCSCFTWVLPGHLFLPLLKFQFLWRSHQALPPIAPSFQCSADLTVTLIQGRFRDLHHSLPIHHYSHHPSLWLQYPLKTPILLSIPRPSFSDPRPPYLYKSVLPHLSRPPARMHPRTSSAPDLRSETSGICSLSTSSYPTSSPLVEPSNTIILQHQGL